jgi:hypothetical protein
MSGFGRTSAPVAICGVLGFLETLNSYKIKPETYLSHTPGSIDEEHLEYFSTSSLSNRADAIRTLIKVLPLLIGHDGVVIEVERVVAKIDESGWHQTPVKDPSILGHEVGFSRNPTMPFEIHMALEFMPTTKEPAIEIRELLNDTTALGLKVGGWFNFLRNDGRWSFRSNAFASIPEPELQALVLDQYQILGNYVAARRLECQRWAIVEHVLGIWRSPLQKMGGATSPLVV